MPKISTQSLYVVHDDIKKHYQITVMYNQKHLFYSEIPSEFEEQLINLSDKRKEELHIKTEYKNRFTSTDGVDKRMVTAPTEAACIDRMRDAIKSLLDQSISKRDVILISYHGSKESNWSNDIDDKFSPVNLKFGYAFATETTSGDSVVYNQYRTHKWHGDKEATVTRTEISKRTAQSCIIIDDTPENRIRLEELHLALTKLRDKIAEITGSPEQLLGFLSSDTKLLTMDVSP